MRDKTCSVARSKDQIIAAIFALDLENVKQQLQDKEEGEGWTVEEANRYETEYKQFLALAIKYPEADISPSKNVDAFWHMHILNTRQYARDCENTFGYFVHHEPGMREGSEAEKSRYEKSFQLFSELREREFANGNKENAAYCGRNPAENSAAYCGLSDKAAKAAYCGLSTGNEKAAYCGLAGKRKKTAYCGLSTEAKSAQVAYCGLSNEMTKAAYCGLSVEKGMEEAAYCGLQSHSAEKTAYCGLSASSREDGAYCGLSQHDKRGQSAYCGFTSITRVKKGAYCGLRSDTQSASPVM